MESTTFWRLALVVMLIILASVQYKKNEGFRGWVNDKCPWVKEQLARHDIKFDDAASPEKGSAGTDGSSSSASTAANSTPTASSRLATTSDLTKIATDPSLWPKTLRLKKPTEFPAVFQGKEVGKVNVPVGAAVKLMQMKGDQLGVAYSPDGSAANSGGKWVPVQDTDFLDKVRISK